MTGPACQAQRCRQVGGANDESGAGGRDGERAQYASHEVLRRRDEPNGAARNSTTNRRPSCPQRHHGWVGARVMVSRPALEGRSYVGCWRPPTAASSRPENVTRAWSAQPEGSATTSRRPSAATRAVAAPTRTSV